MNIEQMLRDAIERKTAKILKEEYGIETPKEIADKSNDAGATAHVEKIFCDDDPLDEKDERPVYQVTLLDAGPNREALIKFITTIRMIEPSYAKALVDHIPSVIVRDSTKKAAMTIVAKLTKLKADCMLERTVLINSVHKQRL